MSYWEDLDRYEERDHQRTIKLVELKHKCKMKELEKEVELYKLKNKEGKEE